MGSSWIASDKGCCDCNEESGASGWVTQGGVEGVAKKKRREVTSACGTTPGSTPSKGLYYLTDATLVFVS